MFNSCLKNVQNLKNHRVEIAKSKNHSNYTLASFRDNWQGIGSDCSHVVFWLH